MTENDSNINIKLVSADSVEFVVNQRIAFMSQLVKQMYNVNPESSQEIVLPELNGEILGRVVEFCTHHVDEPMKEIEKPLKSVTMTEDVDLWDAKYIDLDDQSLYQIVCAANYLMIQPLLDLACAKIASYIKGKNTQEIRDRFHIISDFTPEEEEKIRQDNKWADDL